MTQSIQLRADGRVLSSRSHALQYFPRRRWRTVRSYAAMTWRLIGPAARIAFNNLAGLAVIVTVGAALWIWTP